MNSQKVNKSPQRENWWVGEKTQPYRRFQEVRWTRLQDGGGPHCSWLHVAELIPTGLLDKKKIYPRAKIWEQKFSERTGATRARGQELNLERGESEKATLCESSLSRNRTNKKCQLRTWECEGSGYHTFHIFTCQGSWLVIESTKNLKTHWKRCLLDFQLEIWAILPPCTARWHESVKWISVTCSI